MQLTLDALNYKFMQLGEGDQASDASRHAWDNMGMLPWYQPVKWKHPLATVLGRASDRHDGRRKVAISR